MTLVAPSAAGASSATARMRSAPRNRVAPFHRFRKLWSEGGIGGSTIGGTRATGRNWVHDRMLTGDAGAAHPSAWARGRPTAKAPGGKPQAKA